MRRLLLLLILTATVVGAESIDAKGSIGWTAFPDEGLENHLLLSGSGRFYVTRRFSVETEFQYLRQSSNHHDLVFLPGVAWDFRSQGRVIPYVAGGVGWLRFVQPFSARNTWFFSGGFGTKIYITERWFIAPEIRIGRETHMRVSAGIGYSWFR